MANPKISIIVPVYNVEDFLKTCLDSIIAQSFADFEVICVNDGSPDNSAAILEDYAARDSRIKVITQKNGGLSAARNTGIENAAGEYIYFLDSDDYIHPQMMEIFYREISSGDYDFVSCGFKKVYGPAADFPHYDRYATSEVKEPLPEFCNDKRRLSVNVWSKLYRKDSLGELRFIPGLIYEDLPFTCSFLQQVKRGKIIDLPLYYYLQRNTSLSGNREIKMKNCESYIYILRHLHENFQMHPLFEQFHRRFFASILKTLLKLKKSPQVLAYVRNQLKALYQEKIISYQDLSLRYKFKLWHLFHGF